MVPARQNESIYLSPVTIAELRFGADIASDPKIRLKRLARKLSLAIDAGTGDIFGSLAAQHRAAGRHHRYRVQDIWIASQALQHACRLLTRNGHDFEGIPDLDLVLYELADHKR